MYARLPRLAIATVLGCAVAADPPQAPQRAHFEFSSNGGRLLANGVPFQLKGAIWQGAAGPNDLPDGLAGPHAHTVKHYMELLSSGSFNAIRLEFNHEAVLQSKVVRNFNPNVEPAMNEKTYIQALEVIAREAERHGLLIVLSCVLLAPHERPGNGLWHSAKISEEDSLRSWARLARVFCEQSNVFAVDLFEEPHGSTWGFGPPTLDWHAAAQRIGRYVQGVCPRWLIMVQGARSFPWNQIVPELTPGQNLMGVHEKKIQLADNSKLVYAPHVASPSEHMLPAYQDADFPGNMPAIWGRQFGFVTELTGAPLVVGRVGGLLADELDNTWQRAIFEWIRVQHFGFFYDCLNPNPSSGGLLHKDWGSLRAEKIALLSELVGTPVSSLPPPPPRKPFRPQYNGMLAPVAPSSEAPARTKLICLRNVKATRLRGALDMQAGTQSSSTLLSIFSPTTWDNLVYEVAATPRDHSVVHLEAGDRVEVKFNHTMCFPAPASPASVGAVVAGVALCFQVADITSNSRVRFSNRGCGVLNPKTLEYSFPLNDGGAIVLHSTITETQSFGAGMSAMMPWLALGGLGALALGALLVAYKFPETAGQRCPGAAQQMGLAKKQGLLKAARAADALGFSAIAVELSQMAAERHSRLSTQELPIAASSMRHAHDNVESPKMQELGMSEEEVIAEQENAMKRALELLQRSEKPDVQPPAKALSPPVANFPPPPASFSPAPPTEPANPLLFLSPPTETIAASPAPSIPQTLLSPSAETFEPLVPQTEGLQSAQPPPQQGSPPMQPVQEVADAVEVSTVPIELDAASESGGGAFAETEGECSEVSFTSIMRKPPAPKPKTPSKPKPRQAPMPQAVLD